jgi:hypothetical protein
MRGGAMKAINGTNKSDNLMLEYAIGDHRSGGR